MAKIPPENVTFPSRGVSLKGAFYTRTSRKGHIVVGWPRRQPTPATAKQADIQALIAVAARVCNYMTPQEQDFSKKIAAVTKLQSRDFLMLALFSRIGHFVRRDGTKVYSMASMQDISDLLDALGQLKGMTLFRDETWWTSLPIGDPGDVMTVGPDGLPFWDAGSGGGASGNAFMQLLEPNPNAAPLTIGPSTFIGLPIVPSSTIELNGLNVWVVVPGTSRTIVAAIYSDAGYTMAGGTLLAQSAAIAASAGIVSMPFAAPITLNPNTMYWFGIDVLGGSGDLKTLQSNIQRNNYQYFTQGTSTLPGTAPAVTPGTNALQFTWWGF